MKAVNELALLILWILVAIITLAAIRGVIQGRGPFAGAWDWISLKFARAPIQGNPTTPELPTKQSQVLQPGGVNPIPFGTPFGNSGDVLDQFLFNIPVAGGILRGLEGK